jgi:hypothetical protein
VVQMRPRQRQIPWLFTVSTVQNSSRAVNGMV